MTSEEGHLESFFLNSKCSDVTLCVTLIDERCLRIPSHRFVLASRSPVFEKMFEKDKFIEGKTGVANLTIPGGDRVALSFIRFFYFGDVQSLSLSLALGLLKTAHLYEVESLVMISQKIILNALTPDNACEVYEETKDLGSSGYRKDVLALIFRSAFIIFEKSDHVVLSQDTMATILQSESLNVVSEKQVADALWTWIQWNSLSNRESSTNVDLSNYVRWGLLHPCDLETERERWNLIRTASEYNVTERKPEMRPSLIEFALNFDLMILSDCRSVFEKRIENHTDRTLLRFSTNKDLHLIGIEIIISIHANRVTHLSNNLELIVDNAPFPLAKNETSLKYLVKRNEMGVLTCRILVSLRKPVSLFKERPHEIRLGILGNLGEIFVHGFKADEFAWSLENVEITLYTKNVSISKLYFFSSKVTPFGQKSLLFN